MKAILVFSVLLAITFKPNITFGFTISPVIRDSGQSLSISCDPTSETACLEICNQASFCEIKEPYCRNCAGTQNLKLKRIFDSVGTSLIAVGEQKTTSNLIQIIKNENFISLHSMTLYNYSGPYDGDQVRAQFKYLCPNLPENSEKMGILLLGINPENNSITGVLGAICPDEITGQSFFYNTNSRWQLP